MNVAAFHPCLLQSLEVLLTVMTGVNSTQRKMIPEHHDNNNMIQVHDPRVRTRNPARNNTMSATTYREAKYWHRILNSGHNLTFLPIDTPLHGPHNASTPETNPVCYKITPTHHHNNHTTKRNRNLQTQG